MTLEPFDSLVPEVEFPEQLIGPRLRGVSARVLVTDAAELVEAIIETVDPDDVNAAVENERVLLEA